MSKRLSGVHGGAWALCLGVLLGQASAAQEASGPVYIQGSEVNLRQGTNTAAPVVQKVLIGTECQRQGEVDKKGWVRLRCGEAEGFTLDKLVGGEKPSLEALRAQAEDTTKSARERLDAAARAATLAPGDEPVSQLLARLFFDVNFEQLDKDRRKGGLHESSLVWCNPRAPQQPKTHAQCLTDELEKTEYDWHQLSVREDRFVSAMFQEGALVVYTGYLKPRARGRFNPDEDEFDIVVESRSRSPVADALKAALQRDARVPDPEARKYSFYSAEYKDMPVLSPAAYKLFRSLPSTWYLLSEDSGKRFIQVKCKSINARLLEVDVHRRADLRRRNIPYEDETDGLDVARIKDITKTGPVYQLQLCHDPQCQESQTLTWPTDLPQTARWETPSASGGPDSPRTEYFTPKKGAPNEVRVQSCRELYND